MRANFISPCKTHTYQKHWLILILLFCFFSSFANANTNTSANANTNNSTNSNANTNTKQWLTQLSETAEEIAPELKVLGGLSLLSFIPLFLIATTAFTRIVIVLAMLRHALGLQQSPPNIVMITLALFLTIFTMAPVYLQVNQDAISPYFQEKIALPEAIDIGSEPIKKFMLSQTNEKDFATMINISGAEQPQDESEVSFLQLIPAFLLSELATAFKIAFIIFLPFLAIDLIVASTLMSLGMIMVPPITVALPLKIMLFILIDGWSLLASSLLASFSS